MRARRLYTLTAACCAALLLGAVDATAAPPENDNYLASLQMVEGTAVAREFQHTVETTEATVQADLFDPNRDGIPFGGAEAEATRCGATVYGKTVWYDFTPDTFGGVQIEASGFDAVIRVYEYSRRSSRITRTVLCQNLRSGTSEDALLPRVKRGQSYTIQVGGVGAAGGRLDFRFLFFADQDRDGVLDEQPDRCPRQPGVLASGGCPPELHPVPRLSFEGAGNGVRILGLRVERLPRNTRVEARCQQCGVRQRGNSRDRRFVTLSRFSGQLVPTGARLELFVTKRPTRTGRYRHGAIGTYIRYEIGRNSIGRRTIRCLRPGSLRPRKTCT